MNGGAERNERLERFKGYVTYGTAAALSIGGMLALVGLMYVARIDTDVGIPAMMVIVTLAAQFLFQQVSARQAEKAQERATEQVIRAAGTLTPLLDPASGIPVEKMATPDPEAT